MTTDEQRFLEQKIDALQHAERRNQFTDSPFMTQDAAYALGKEIEREFPGLSVEVKPCEAPYAGSYFVVVTRRFHMVIRSAEQWSERKKHIKKSE